MAKDLSKMPLPKLDDLFTTEEERANASLEKVVDIKISDIDDFPDHPFKVIDDDEMEKMKNSISNLFYHTKLGISSTDSKNISPSAAFFAFQSFYASYSGHHLSRRAGQ